ncbi:uncharacterized protein [Diadema setosum]|uniref:uncharacterized protein n=1 Tax=Diadema setosum TaxID=31175 RepID=UPI003B3B7064
MSKLLNSFLGKLRSPNQLSSDVTSNTPCPEWAGAADQEEDGFLLVGETENERNTVLPPHMVRRSESWQGSPPPYHTQVQQRASYDPSLLANQSGHWSAMIHQTETLSSPCVTESTDCSHQRHQSYAALMMEDVPFKLSDQMNCIQMLSRDSSYFGIPQLSNYNPSKYIYDFEYEHRVIRELDSVSD